MHVTCIEHNSVDLCVFVCVCRKKERKERERLISGILCRNQFPKNGVKQFSIIGIQGLTYKFKS